MADVIPFPAPDRPCAKLHVWPGPDGFEVHHESTSGDSWAYLGSYTSREAALAAAIAALPAYPGTRLGEVAA
jgi:hypothetical protein